MKKFLAITLVLVTLTLCFASCGPKDAIKVNPNDFNMPDTYEVVYTCVSANEDDEDGDGYDITQTIAGCDADGNFFYSGESYKALYLAIEEDSYNGYYDEGTGTYELKKEGSRWIDAASACFGFIDYTYDEIKEGGSYEKIEALTLPEDLSGKELIFLDSERFEYYVVTGGRMREGQAFETAVEKETGSCFYAYYKGDSDSYYGEYYFYVSEYTTPYNGNYATLLPKSAD